MIKNQSWSGKELFLAFMAVFFMLFVHGAVPFLMTPSFGAVWPMGFSQSFANGAFFDFYAHEFGIPKPAAIAFGLAEAWPASLLIRLGLHPADAYTGMVAIWLSLAMFSAYQIARRFGAKRSVSLLSAVAWMSMPIIWAHVEYSMLSLGIALLSFYFMAALRLFLIESESTRIAPTVIALYFASTIVSVFMDGYTFMMFAMGSSILLLYSFVSRPEIRQTLVKIAVPVHIAGFALAYILFSIYIGKLNFETHPSSVFRGWGLDLSFIAIPTKGMLWLPDLLGLSVERTNEIYFGDASVWVTTFAMPVLVFGLFAWWRARRQIKTLTGILFVVIFGFYMALGPSLKINSTKPESLRISHPRQQSELMSSEYAMIPTGNVWISKTLPGFNVMRASYRWFALSIFGLWLLIILCVSRIDEKYKHFWLLALFFVIIFNLPDLHKRWLAGVNDRALFQQIDRDLVDELRQHIRPTEIVAFIPWGNDFIANYLASRSGFRTFNIGGDKNLLAAQSSWPSEMLHLGGEIDAGKVLSALKMLVDGTANVLVFPYFHMIWSLRQWPCAEIIRLNSRQQEKFHNSSGLVCPAEQKADLQPILRALRDSPYVDVLDSTLYTMIKLRSEFSGSGARSALMNAIYRKIQYPLVLGDAFENHPYILGEGWHVLETRHVWSGSSAKLMLPIPKECELKTCKAALQFTVFGANSQRSVSVSFDAVNQEYPWNEKIVATSGDSIQVMVPLTNELLGRQEISISVPDATSPSVLSGSADTRVLGIALRRIDLLSE